MLKFIETVSTDGEFIFQMSSECNKIVIGVYPVIYGFRVRAGFIGDMFYYLDYCCGNEQGDIELIFSAVKNILEQRSIDDRQLFNFPHQEYKPFMKNITEFKQLISEINKETYQRVKLDNIHIKKTLYMINVLGYDMFKSK
jgi:hypothetical protein